MDAVTESRILPADHPLASVFSVGPDAPADRQAAAAEVLGVAIGQKVLCLFRSHRGESATVVRLNPADREIGVSLGDPDRILWCRFSEILTGESAYKAAAALQTV